MNPSLDLNEHLVRHPAATYFVRAEGDAMTGAGIHNGDILVVDRALPFTEGSLAVATVNGEFTVRRIRRGEELDVWGIVTYVIHKCSH